MQVIESVLAKPSRQAARLGCAYDKARSDAGLVRLMTHENELGTFFPFGLPGTVTSDPPE